MTADSPRPYFTPTQLARFMGWSRDTVYEAMARRGLPYHQISARKRLIAWSEFAAWVESFGGLPKPALVKRGAA